MVAPFHFATFLLIKYIFDEKYQGKGWLSAAVSTGESAVANGVYFLGLVYFHAGGCFVYLSFLDHVDDLSG